ncbi:MAG: hypothetical protein ACTHNW_09805 [Mucilaginibacter sp.]
MKTLSLLLLVSLLFTTAYAQDTAKVHHSKLTLHQLWRSMLYGPQEMNRFRRHEDSLIRPTLPPEGHHPAVYIDGEVGYAFLGIHGFESSAAINYQGDGDGMFTLKGLNISAFKSSDNPYNKNRLIIIDDIKTNSLDQVALLYGKRLVDRTHQQAFNFSAGIAIESRYFYYYSFSPNSQTRYQHAATYPGVPLEANYQLFSRRFGASFNFKVSGDISKYSFASVGVALGLGYHYKN